MNLRIKAGVDHFHDVRTMSHKDVAMLARSVELDIAVDLGGFTQNSRTGIFADVSSTHTNQLDWDIQGQWVQITMTIWWQIKQSFLKKTKNITQKKLFIMPNSYQVNVSKSKCF